MAAVMVRSIDFIRDPEEKVTDVNIRYGINESNKFSAEGHVRVTVEEFEATGTKEEEMNALVLEKVKGFLI